MRAALIAAASSEQRNRIAATSPSSVVQSAVFGDGAVSRSCRASISNLSVHPRRRPYEAHEGGVLARRALAAGDAAPDGRARWVCADTIQLSVMIAGGSVPTGIQLASEIA
jgi:hypothetical protein